ncbi:MAG TPA: zinc metallopeptidase [Chloroflexi bacterium]|jgi:Zn-dependent membrane protease YugP|nr:zinc metallopeptidase [Chloroflexota bacterium]
MFFPVFDPRYYLFALPALILGLYAQYRVRSSYQKYLQVRNARGMAGYEAARRLLEANGLYNVSVHETPGQLTDHYDPRRKALFLSPAVARSATVASLGIVAHEVGHAVQDAVNYGPMRLRAGLVPAVQIGSWLGPIIFMAGLFLPIPNLSLVGLLLFSGTLVFSLVTLPVEYNASNRAVAMLQRSGLLTGADEKGVRQVLSAAALTYVAATAQALSTILYYLFILGGRRRD